MDSKDVQTLFASGNYFQGVINGVWNDDTLTAAKMIVDRHISELVDFDKWDRSRMIIGAAQLILKYAGMEPGALDGYNGNNTKNAFDAWAQNKALNKPVIIDRTPVESYVPSKGHFPKQSGCVAFYGQPGLPGSSAEEAMEKKLVFIDLPMPFRIDYSLSQSVTRMRFHNLCAASAKEGFAQAVKHYGAGQFQKLGLDRFAGSYMPRKMRGGTSFSMHAYGCAFDTYAAPNDLNTHKPKALFSGADYVAWFNIWEALGWTSLGRAIDRDYMHIQAASL